MEKKLALKKIKILHLIDFLGPGGVQELVRLMIKKSSSDFTHEVVALTSFKPYHERSIREAGAEVKYLSGQWRSGLACRSPFLAMRFRNIMHAFKPDVLHMHMPGSMIIGCMASANMKVKRILGIYAWKRAFSPWVYPAARLLLPMLDRIAWVDQSELAWLPDEKFVRVFPGADMPEDFVDGAEKIKNEFSLEGRGPFLFSIGRLHPDKGHADAIRAFVEIQRFLPRAVLLVIGEGEKKETARLSRLGEILGKGRVIFTGHREDLKSFLGLGGFFLRTSKNECGNMSMILSAFAGVVSIGYSMKNILPSDIEMIGHDQIGKVVPYGDFKKMAQEVVRLWENRPEFERLSRESVRHAQKHWDVQKCMVDPVEAAYRGLLV